MQTSATAYMLSVGWQPASSSCKPFRSFVSHCAPLPLLRFEQRNDTQQTLMTLLAGGVCPIAPCFSTSTDLMTKQCLLGRCTTEQPRQGSTCQLKDNTTGVCDFTGQCVPLSCGAHRRLLACGECCQQHGKSPQYLASGPKVEARQ